MRRAALMLAIAGLGSGCHSSSRSGDVTIYWDFARNLPAGGSLTYTCAQAGVDYVVVTFPDGSYVDPATPTLPCLFSGVQGATFLDFRGRTTFVVTGYRNGVSSPLYTGQGTVDVVGGSDNPVTIVAAGLQADLTVSAVLTLGGVTYLTCGAASIQRFDFILRDGTPTVVDQGSVACAAGDTPGVSFGFIDLDDYTLTLDAVETGATPAQDQIIWSVCRLPLQHFGNDDFQVTLPPGVCQNP